MFQAFALICMLNGECAVLSDGIQITDRSLCDKFHLATLTRIFQQTQHSLDLPAKVHSSISGASDVSSIPQNELANYVIDFLRSDHDSQRSAKTDAAKKEGREIRALALRATQS